MDLPLIIEPDALEAALGTPGLLVVDLSRQSTHAQFHVPGAVFLEYASIIRPQPPAMGMVADDAQLEQVFSAIGIGPDTHVVAYDDEGGGKAARLLYTLEVVGHSGYSLLNGGLHAWANEGHPLDKDPVQPRPAPFVARPNSDPIADKAHILDRLGASDLALLDTRNEQEFSGARRFAQKAGHIPGAVHWEWTQSMDMNRNLRLKPVEELRAGLEALGVNNDAEVVVYCQTHHRAAHTYIVLKALGYPRVKGYPGAWSEWGNSPDTPVE